MRRSQQCGRYNVLGWFLALLLSQFCSVVVAAKKSGVHDLSIATSTTSEYDAFLKKARFVPSTQQQKAVESLFFQLKARHITIKPTLCRLLALAQSDQLLPLCKKIALFFSHVDNTRIKNSGSLSSMIRNKKHIRDFIGQQDSDIAMLATLPCLSAVTGMCNNRGIPDAQTVKSLLSWPAWQVDGEFSCDLFRSFSGMLCSRGLPKEPDVDVVRSWPVWQLNGQFNHELFRSFSGMFARRGLPKEPDVNALLSWPVWQLNGQFNHELFRSFSCMYTGQGLPKEQDVQAILAWPVWQLDGQFNYELFRSFSSMFHGRRLPKEQDVQAVLAWPVWQVDGQFNYELFRSFSSMFNGRRLPKEQDVQAVLAWPVWQLDGQFNYGLFRSFTSMFNGKELPKEPDVNAILSWPVWKVGGQFNSELFRSFTSMFNGKRLPKEVDVKAIVSWPCWQVNGEFNCDLFRSLSAMFSGRGLPKKKEVETLLSWPVWQREGQFSYELFRSFSSMFTGKGLPVEADVQALLAWPVWQVDGQFNSELFRSFTAMFNAKRLPKEQDVQAILAWPVWQVDGQFNCELFRSFTSMFNGKGLPREPDVKAILSWPAWQVDGQFNYPLFRLLATMSHGRGLPKKQDVQAFLAWPAWQLDGQFSYELLRSFSSMFSGRGLPKEFDVNAILSWPVWQVGGQFNHEIFRSFSAMFNGRGLPQECDVTACMEWLSGADGIDRETLQIMNRLFCGAFKGHKSLGLPPIDRLRGYEQRLSQLFGAWATDGDPCTFEIKQIALFLANKGGGNYLSWPECERFLKVYSGQLHANEAEAAPSLAALAPARLHRVLLAHGGAGIRTFFAVNDKQGWTNSTNEREQQLALLSLPVALETIRCAFNLAPPESRRDYIFFGSKRATAPDYGQWHEICAWRRVLPSRLSNPYSQRDFIDLAVTLPDNCKKRLMTKAAIEAVITLFPSVHILRILADHHSPANLAELFHATLDYVQKRQYDTATLTTLLPALLQNGLTLPSSAPKAEPHHTFVNREPCDGGTTIHCPVDVADGETLLHSFIATFTAMASDRLTTFESGHFTVEAYGSERFCFAVPKCVAAPQGFTISNWSPEEFKLFFGVTENSAFYRAKPTWQDGQEPYVSDRQKRIEAATTATSCDNSCDNPFTPLSLSTLALIIKNSAPINGWVWQSFAHQRHGLSESICQQLLPRALAATDEVPPDFMDWLQSRCQLQQTAPPQSPVAEHSLAAPVVSEESFEHLWAVLADKALLDGADLALFNNCYEQLSFEQLASVVERASLLLPAATLAIWRARLTEARQLRSARTPVLRDLDDDLYELVMGAMAP